MRLSFCALCGEDDSAALEHHHYIPASQGGTDDENNIFTVCGTCHGRIHAIPRPHRLGDLVRAGQQKERSVAELQEIAQRKATAAENAALAVDYADACERAKIKRWQRLGERLMATPLHPTKTASTPLRSPAAPIRIEKKEELVLPYVDKRLSTVGSWAIATDGIQWILQRSRSSGWESVSFVRSTKDVLRRCCRDRGIPANVIDALLANLPRSFDDSPVRLRRARWGRMYRVRMPVGHLSDMVNLSRAKDAARGLPGSEVVSAELQREAAE